MSGEPERGPRSRRDAGLDQLATISEGDERVVLATGRYIGEGFDDARLDTLFLTMPVSWKGPGFRPSSTPTRSWELTPYQACPPQQTSAVGRFLGNKRGGGTSC